MSVKSTSTGVYIGVGSAWVELRSTDFSFDRTIENDDITDMCSGGWRETSSQLRQVSVPVNGVFNASSAAYAKLVERYMASASEDLTIDEATYSCDWGQIPMKCVTGSGAEYAGVSQINSLGEASSYNQDVRFSLDSQFSGSVTDVS